MLTAAGEAARAVWDSAAQVLPAGIIATRGAETTLGKVGLVMGCRCPVPRGGDNAGASL